MNLSLQYARIALERRGSIHLLDAAGVRIACRSGVVWITQHHDTRDIVLHAGETLEIDRCGVTIVQATEPARLTLEERPRQSTEAGQFDGLHVVNDRHGYLNRKTVPPSFWPPSSVVP